MKLLKSHVNNKLKSLKDNKKDTHGIIMQLNEIMDSCSESCVLSKKRRKNVRYYDLDCKIMKGEGRYLLNCLNECESAEDQRLRLAKYKDKRREYKSLIKWRKKSIRISRNWTLLMILRKKKFLRSFFCYLRNDSGKGKFNTQFVLEADSSSD